MAAKAPDTTKPVGEMVKSSKLDSSLKLGEATLPSYKEGALSDATSCISSVDATCSAKESELDHESFGPEQPIYYPMTDSYACYYPGFNSYLGWDNQGYCLGSDGLEMQQEAVQQDNGSFVYYMPNFQLGYDPYTAFMPGPIVGVDGQHVAQQPYAQNSIVSQPFSSPGYFQPTIAYGPDMIPVYGWDPSFWNTNSGSGLAEANVPAPKPKFSSKAQASKPTLKPKTNFPTETKGPSPVLELPRRGDVPKQSPNPVNKIPAPSKSYFPVTKIPSYPCYSYSPISVKENGQNWASSDKLKSRNKSGGGGDFDLLDEQNRGPRTNSYRNAWTAGSDHAGMPVTKVEDNFTSKTVVVRRDEYNLPDFPTKYDHALFFVIKSYSEDDIHKSIKYNVWASTSNGNKRLDSAFQAAQEKMKEKGSKCPLFLFFSVNASGQFCGIAEMIGRVDFDKSMDFWQQDKWNGYFPVKWHIVKDVPNPQFRHIVLENNDNKPVTNSRDTQEVKFSQGTEMLNIFKNFSSKTSILDDFGFYENRQKVMQDKRSKVYPAPVQHLFPKNNEPAEQPKKIDAVKTIASSLEALELDPVAEKKADLEVVAC